MRMEGHLSRKSEKRRELRRKKETHELLAWLRQVETIGQRQGLALSTIRKKQRILQKVLSAVPSVTPESVKEFLETYRNNQTAQPLKSSTKNTIKSEIRWFLNHVQPQLWTKEYQRVLQREASRTPGQKIDPGKLEQLLTFAPSYVHALAYQLIWVGGFRPHELLSLTLDHVKFLGEDRAVISIPHANPKVPSCKNKTGERPVYLEGEVVAELASHSRYCQEKGEKFLFPWSHGTLSTHFCRMKQRYAEWCHQHHQTPFTGRLYDLRHSAATRLASEGMPDQLLRKLMGWSPSSRMPAIYIHLDEQDLLQWFLSED